MLSVAEALAQVTQRMPRLAAEPIAIDDAVGRVLAEDVVAPRALPGFDNSAMDGYAARSAELPATLPIAAVIGAGEVLAGVPPHYAVRIFTGAPIPGDLDTVVMQEDAKREGDRVVLPASPAGEHIRRAGEDIARGEHVLSRGARLRPWDVGVLAALGIARVAVARAPCVAIVSTGDELVDLHTPPAEKPDGDTGVADALSNPDPVLARGQRFDSSAHVLAAMIREAGGIPTRTGIARDTPDEIRALLERAAGCDVVITTGGVSVGERDHVRACLDEIELYKVAMKPGKPFTFGKTGTTPVFGLPGNPVSTVVGFELFVRPALLAMQGATTLGRPRTTVVLPHGYRKPAGRAHYLRARIADGVAHVHPKQGSAMLSSLVGTSALVEIPADTTEVIPGGVVRAILLERT